MEFNLENLAYHGGRSLHIPILIISGCICIITAALLFRFLHLNKNTDEEMETTQENPEAEYNISDKDFNPYIMLNMAAGTMVSSHMLTGKPEKVLVECPGCNKFFGVISVSEKNEIPCPHCGIIGTVNLVTN